MEIWGIKPEDSNQFGRTIYLLLFGMLDLYNYYDKKCLIFLIL